MSENRDVIETYAKAAAWVGHTSRALLTVQTALSTAAFAALADSVLTEVQAAGNPLGREIQPPDRPMDHTLALLARLASHGGNGVPLLLAAIGRGQLPPSFSVLQPQLGHRPAEGEPR